MSNVEQGFTVIWIWLRTPLSGNMHHEIDALTAWHGRLMVFSWGILVPLGIGVARYYKVTRNQDWPTQLDNTFWWNTHRALQYAATLFMTVGVFLMVATIPKISPAGRLHATMGWSVFFLCWLQIASASARGSKGGPSGSNAVGGSADDLFGDHYNMTRRRKAFEYIHKGGGYAAAVLAAASILIGLKLADAPRWMPSVILGWWFLLCLVAVRLQRQGRCIDTYQAIWGSSSDHPGNKMRVIGWGIARHTPPDKRLP